MATIGAWTWLGANLVVFDPLLRVMSLWGKPALEWVGAVLCHSSSWSIKAGLCHLDMQGLENIPHNGRVIVICNHQSLVESFLPFWILHTLRPKFIAKRVMGSWIPSVSFILRAGGSCLIDRGNHQEALAKIKQLGEQVNRQEVSAIIFPEGTRSTQGKLGRFRASGLLTLMRAAPQAAILPMVVCNGDRVFPKGRPRVQAGSTVKVRFLPIITPEQLKLARELPEKNEDAEQSLTEKHHDFDAAELRQVNYLFEQLNAAFIALQGEQ